jgi:hypothetical protein
MEDLDEYECVIARRFFSFGVPRRSFASKEQEEREAILSETDSTIEAVSHLPLLSPDTMSRGHRLLHLCGGISALSDSTPVF